MNKSRYISGMGGYQLQSILAFLILFGCCIPVPSVHAQRTWFSHENTWYQSKYIQMECPDTLMNDTIWTPIHTSMYDPSVDSLYCSWGSGYIVNINEKVFYKDIVQNKTRIIYDYGMSIGDTIFLQPDIWQSDFVLSDIDTVFVLGKYRRRYLLEMTDYNEFDIWIEGIGSIENDYLQSGEPDHLITDAGTLFVCFREAPGDSIYQLNNWPGCLLDSLHCPCAGLSDIRPLVTNTPTFELYPNPTQQMLSVNSTESIDRVHIYDNLGNIRAISSPKSASFDINLPDHALKPGLYFIRLTVGTHQIVKSVILTE